MSGISEDRTDAGKPSFTRARVDSGGAVLFATGGQQSRLAASDSSLGAWIGAHLGAVEGVLGVYFVHEPATAARPAANRVFTILRSPRDPELREALRARESSAAAKFPELAFHFEVTDRADPPALGAKLVYTAS